MRKLKTYITIFITGLIAGIALFLNLTRSSESDPELSELASEGDDLADQVESLESELDGLSVGEELTDEESVEFWDNL